MASKISRRDFLWGSALLTGCSVSSHVPWPLETKSDRIANIIALTRSIGAVRVAVPAAAEVFPLATSKPSADIDLKRMAAWAMNYLIQTPRKDLGYEPVFQCQPYACPPIPSGHDPVVACDTDARMDWEWYYMREISGTEAGRDVEAAFHKRIRDYIAPNGKVWSHPGAFNESKISARYTKADLVVHIWGATKILAVWPRTTRAAATRKLRRLPEKGCKPPFHSYQRPFAT